MTDPSPSRANEAIGVSLVDGEPAVRRARQIMLRSEHYDVRSYATCEALLADPRARDYGCIVLDVCMIEGHGAELLRQMRATGWRGTGILLDGITADPALKENAARRGDKVFERTISDRALVEAIGGALDRGGRGWNGA